MAQQRRREQLLKRRQRKITALCIVGGIGVAVLSLVACLLIFDIGEEAAPVVPPITTSLPYDATQPFSISDLTVTQVSTIRAQGRMNVSDGPRGVSIGDTLETLLTRLPTSYTGEQPDDEEQILYCAEVFENQNGFATVLPPRGMITVESGNIVVTLMAPTSAYPSGTKDNFAVYEHVYCLFTIEPDGMTINSIVLGITG